MKTKIANLFFFSAMTVFLFACGGGSENENKENNEEQSAVNPSSEESGMDADAIDPDAPVFEVEISANGNTMAEIFYNKKEITVPAGCTVKVKFKNNSTDASMPHNLIFIERGSAQKVADEGMKMGQARNFRPVMDEVIAGSDLLPPGGEQEFSFKAPAPGEYQFICTYPGHLKAMNGVFLVEE